MKTLKIIDWRSKHEVLTEPMTVKELKAAVTKDGIVKVKVSYPLEYVLDESRIGVETDMATAITANPEGLTNIKIEIAGKDVPKNLILKVTAKVEFETL